MTDEVRIYTPETVQDTPFPDEVVTGFPSSSGGASGVYTPNTVAEKKFPTVRRAVELISTALNTKSKKILQEFQFAVSGALQIGKYENGVSGDLRISPNGITARNDSGVTTFAIDGTTGDANFAGTIQAGTVIVGSTIVHEESGNGNGRTVYYNNGVPAIVIGDPE